MKKFIQAVLASLAVVIVVGTIASAAPGLRTSPSAKPTPSVAHSLKNPEPTETESPDSTDTESDSPNPADTGSSGAEPDFSACAGLTGLDNAICHHQALLAINPTNHGLANSLAHLQANLTKHLAHDAAKASGVHGNSDSAPGHTGDSHTNDGGRSQH